jgi:phage I-like protein
MKHASLALLISALALQASADTHLLPAGEFKGRDGRPGKDLTWKLFDPQGRTLAAQLNVRHARVKFNLDYEHQALLSEQNGQPAPASGWATRFEWRDGVGLFALATEWTTRAKQMIEAGEYAYISPVIVYDAKTGVVTGLFNASLVNIPCLDLNPVAQSRISKLNATAFFATLFPQPTQTEQSTMNPLLKALLKSLGLPETDATTEDQAVTAVETLKASAATAQGLNVEVAALKARANSTDNPNPAKWVALDKFTELSTQVASLSAANVDREVEDLLSGARGEGKCGPVVEAVWRDVGKSSIAQLKALIASTPANLALAGLSQTAGRQQSKPDTSAQATADELAMCKNLGMTLEQFRAGADITA